SPGSRITRSGADIRAHECIEFRNFASVESQTPLGAPPNNIGSGQRPFVSHEVAYFSLIEIGAKTMAQRGSLRRVSQQLACTRAIKAHQPAGMTVVEEAIVAHQRLHLRLKPRRGKITAGQWCIGSP